MPQPLTDTPAIVAHHERDGQLAPVRDDGRPDGSPVAKDRDEGVTEYEVQNARYEDQPEELDRILLNESRRTHEHVERINHVGKTQQTGNITRLSQAGIAYEEAVDFRHPDADEERGDQCHRLTEEIQFAISPEVAVAKEALDLRHQCQCQGRGDHHRIIAHRATMREQSYLIIRDLILTHHDTR